MFYVAEDGKFKKVDVDDLTKIIGALRKHASGDIETLILNDEELQQDKKMELLKKLTNTDYSFSPKLPEILLSLFYKHRDIPLASVKKRNIKLS